MSYILVVIPNWNGKDLLGRCLDSLLLQSIKPDIVIVDNGSIDGSIDFLKKNYPEINLILHNKNMGFAGGVNAGIKKAIKENFDYVALFNNDAVADKDWLKNLLDTMDKNSGLGIATCKLVDSTGEHLDSTGDQYTSWGLPYPRGRGEKQLDKYDDQTEIFGASGGASLYRIKMLKEIGLFDEDFFAYYEDTDLSFRAQLAGWKVAYAPKSIAYHSIGATSSKIKGFTTYQTLKNLPLLFWKNVPIKLMPIVLPRLALSDTAFYLSAVQRGQFWPATKGVLWALVLIPKKLVERHHIQKTRQVSDEYIRSIMLFDLPPNAAKLRELRNKWRKLPK